MVHHPMKPELDDKDLSNQRDLNGVAIVVEAVVAARRGQHEFVDYLWPRGSGSQPVARVSTSAGW
ncbi:MAG: methyl-accepting chemotaxis sensory transducer with Cache sensor [Proteobacteria bacterium]|nr:methyl-accepting chemotaxis sensory transducer with Cache sensor [Pseudomonadota bacterium]